jgi:hypothetical protein
VHSTITIIHWMYNVVRCVVCTHSTCNCNCNSDCVIGKRLACYTNNKSWLLLLSLVHVHVHRQFGMAQITNSLTIPFHILYCIVLYLLCVAFSTLSNDIVFHIHI